MHECNLTVTLNQPAKLSAIVVVAGGCIGSGEFFVLVVLVLAVVVVSIAAVAVVASAVSSLFAEV